MLVKVTISRSVVVDIKRRLYKLLLLCEWVVGRWCDFKKMYLVLLSPSVFNHLILPGLLEDDNVANGLYGLFLIKGLVPLPDVSVTTRPANCIVGDDRRLLFVLLRDGVLMSVVFILVLESPFCRKLVIFILESSKGGVIPVFISLLFTLVASTKDFFSHLSRMYLSIALEKR